MAQLLGIPANQASFHLRPLAKFGLVEEDPGAARDKRDRVWRATEEAGFDVSIGEIEKMPGGRAASKVFRRTKEAWTHRLVADAYGDDRAPGIHRTVTEQAVRLTKAEARELTEELDRRRRRVAERNQSESDDGAPDLPRPPDRAAVPRPARRSPDGGPPPAGRPGRGRRGPDAGRPRSPASADLRLLTKHFLAVLEERAPGHSVEVRVPPYAAVQVIPGVRHTRGTPPAVVETDAETWIALATGELAWADALAAARVSASAASAPTSRRTCRC